jgi:diguanylate cyclase (GGDEF)-like protein
MTGSTIRTRLTWLGILFIGVLVGSAALVIDMQRQAALDAFATATMNLANGMAQQTAQVLASVDNALVEIQADLILPSGVAENGADVLSRLASAHDRLADQRNQSAGAEAFALIGADGALASATPGWSANAANLSGSDYFRHFRETDDPAAFAGTPERDPATGARHAVLARRLNDGQGHFAGVVAAEISLSKLLAFYHLAMPRARSVHLLRRDGTILVAYPDRETETGGKVPDQSPWYGVVAAGGGTYQAPGLLDGIRVVAAVRPLRELPFVVEASVTEADALSEWYRQRLWIVGSAAAAGVGGLLLLRLFGAQYIRLELSQRSLAAKNVELDSAHRQLDATLANLIQGVCFFDEQARIVCCNRRYGELYDLPEGSVRPGMTLMQVANLRLAAGTFPTGSVTDYVAAIEQAARSALASDSIAELANGRIVASHIQPVPNQGWVVTDEDITQRREAEARIAFLANHDVLTGLANRALFQDRLARAAAKVRRGLRFAILCIDLDRFKAVNDTFGHPTGDALLRAVADRLRLVTREGDTVARLGGDEFAVLMLGYTHVNEPSAIAQRIVHSLMQPFVLDGHTVGIGASVGIALTGEDDPDVELVMRQADLALYQAKQGGRGTWRCFEPAMDTPAEKRRALEEDLGSALTRGELELHYQPMVHGRTHRLSGFEALLRWRHPCRGLLLPDQFISLAQECGLIVEIGAWVLRQACREAMKWPDHMRVAVNLSPRQFRGGTLAGIVSGAIRDARISPERLDLGMTESVRLAEDREMLATLHDLRGLGARISLDSFGTGYSPLSCLLSFAFDTIKIDRSFISGLGTSDRSRDLVGGMLALAANMRMAVIAVGVETEAEFEALADAGCTEFQGLLVSRPVPAGAIPALIQRLTITGEAPATDAMAGAV